MSADNNEVEKVIAQMAADSVIEKMEAESADPVLHRHHSEHVMHLIRVKAFELWKAMKTSNGVDYGPDFYWYQAEYDLGFSNHAPLPPPVE
jgi:hypothetical protein